jgi:signal transduction histidine kinase
MAGKWNLQFLSIKMRLRVFFCAVVVLMLLGSILSFWQFRNVSGYATREWQSERRVTALLRLNDALITLMGRLHRSAAHGDAAQFEREANSLLADFQKNSANTREELIDIAQESDRNLVLVSSIHAMLDNLPGRISSFIQLAKSGDWNAVYARLLNQADSTDDVVAALMRSAEADLAGARARRVEDLKLAQQRAANVLALSTVFSLAVAGLLGTVVTRTITKPLSDLDAGTGALAAGNFHYRVPVSGNDELASLAQAFNRSAAELERVFEELARANSDLQQFAYSASHDLQEPLRVVALYSQLLHRRYSGQLDSAAEEYIGYISRGARQLEQLIKDLLTYTQTSGAGDHTQGVTDINLVLEQVLRSLHLQIRDQSCTVTADSLPNVRAHDVHVQQLLQNLIANAIRYRGDLPPKIHVAAERNGNYWTLSVRDNGIGVDPQYAKQIFGIFKRLHGQKYPGTGIGLAICQKIVEGYGGSIWVESQEGRGATFRFTLPMA